MMWSHWRAQQGSGHQNRSSGMMPSGRTSFWVVFFSIQNADTWGPWDLWGCHLRFFSIFVHFWIPSTQQCTWQQACNNYIWVELKDNTIAFHRLRDSHGQQTCEMMFILAINQRIRELKRNAFFFLTWQMVKTQKSYLGLVKCKDTSSFIQVNVGVNEFQCWGQFGGVSKPLCAFFFDLVILLQ